MQSELVIRAQGGDEAAFASLALAIADRLHGLAQRILRDLDVAEDATQQALVAIWRDLPQLRDPARFEAWAFRLLVNACYAEMRRRRRSVAAAEVVHLEDRTQPDASRGLADRDQLERGFRRLSLEHRVVVALHYYLDMPLDQIAETVGIPPGTARSRLYHAIRALRAALDSDSRTGIGSVGQ